MTRALPRYWWVAALVAWTAVIGFFFFVVVATPNSKAKPTTHARMGNVEELIRKCSIGLDRQTCEDAFYCSSDPQACLTITQQRPPQEELIGAH
jgi:hypothetical protein